MTKIVFNNNITNSMEIISFNRSSDRINGRSIGYISIVANENTINQLEELNNTPIKIITLYNEEKPIYNLKNTNAEITSIEESLQNNQVIINLNIIFNSGIKNNE